MTHNLARVLDAEVTFQTHRLAMPLLLSSGVIESLTKATASVAVEVAGRRAVGRGAVYLSDLWAWPAATVSHNERDAALRRLCEMIAAELPRQLGRDALHPLELGLRLHAWVCHDMPLNPDPAVLARAMCGSPFDAAIHDATGLALERSALALYGDDSPIPSADRFFSGSGACRAITETLQTPRSSLPAWYVVGCDDCLDRAFGPAIGQHGYGAFKVKIAGRDHGTDVERTVEVFRKALEYGVLAPRITIDSNEANPSADSVLHYLDHLKATDARAYEALEYIEQPTARDIVRHAYEWRPVARRKPVLLDEGLTGLDMLEEARRQGYSGLALKTCKGHSLLMVAAAWAVRNGMLTSIQDLTNPGIALIHAAILGSHLPTINGAELNSPQFTPAANAQYLPRLRGLFVPRDGRHELPRRVPHGLGSTL